MFLDALERTQKATAQVDVMRGYRVLVLDLDPQASLTTFFGFRPELEFADGGTIYDALRYEDQVPLSNVIQKTYFHKSTGLLVTVVPGMLDIASMSQFLKLASETVKAVEEAIGRRVTWDFVKFLITRYEPSDGPQTQMAGYLRSILAGQVMTSKYPNGMGASLMARNIFNQPPKDETESAAPSATPAKAVKLPGSVGGLRDSLREITANSIRDIEPDQIDMDGLRDRLVLEDSSIDELAESIRKHGQQVPIMVRPSAQPDRYRIIYGTVKAIVRTLDDDASLIAQGQENNLRLDPSFIEKSLFIKEMQESGYKPGVIQDALGLTRQGVSNHRVVIEQLPDGLVQLIGPAHGIGRRQWGDLAALSVKVDLVDIAKEALAALPDDTPSSEKFQAVYSACSSGSKSTRKLRFCNSSYSGGMREALGPNPGHTEQHEQRRKAKTRKKRAPQSFPWRALII